MIEEIVLNHLKAMLRVPVYMEQPVEPEASFVLLEKTGSRRQNLVKSATLAVQSYAPSLVEAADLNEAVKAAMDNSVDLPEICKASLNSDYNYTDTDTKRYRYQAVYDITHY